MYVLGTLTVHTNLLMWVYLIGRSEPSVPEINLLQMNNRKSGTGDESLQPPKSKSPEILIESSLTVITKVTGSIRSD